MFFRFVTAATLFGAVTVAASDPAQESKSKKDGPNGRYEIDPVHSSNWFKVKHMGVANFYGRFNKVGGKLLVDGDNPAESMISLSIDPASIDTHNADRDKHLKSPDFFNAEEFKEITFDSEKLVAKGGNKFDVTGTMKLHGVEKEITITVEQTGFGADPRLGTVVGYEARFTIKRSDFKMGYALDTLGDEVEAVFSIEGNRQ